MNASNKKDEMNANVDKQVCSYSCWDTPQPLIWCIVIPECTYIHNYISKTMPWDPSPGKVCQQKHSIRCRHFAYSPWQRKRLTSGKGLLCHSQGSLGLLTSNFTEHRQCTRPFCEHEGSWYKQDHFITISQWMNFPKIITQKYTWWILSKVRDSEVLYTSALT